MLKMCNRAKKRLTGCNIIRKCSWNRRTGCIPYCGIGLVLFLGVGGSVCKFGYRHFAMYI